MKNLDDLLRGNITAQKLSQICNIVKNEVQHKTRAGEKVSMVDIVDIVLKRTDNNNTAIALVAFYCGYYFSDTIVAHIELEIKDSESDILNLKKRKN